MAAGDFQKADDITRAALIQLAGPGAVKRNWVYFTGGRQKQEDMQCQRPDAAYALVPRRARAQV